MGDAERSQLLDEIRQTVNRTVMQMPAHEDCVARYSGLPGQAAAKA